ncbi:hypothetical protein BDV25DRAFT_136240 [Aspergillus avenaceus]|uniref:Uncharacterized protein n=1 Tax=Aspergillus avenaceus TaxID=36643 RepID=A0A5N6U696_ASPAV|nr:hypothetical protein BDV25DRAFT_136240 [Aspergillus avenaceus]
MRLINTTTHVLQDPFYGEIPDYAILSHRWRQDASLEVTFEEMESKTEEEIKTVSTKEEERYSKIINCCKQASLVGLEHVWVDTCCIKKSSTAELTDALVSMWQWYRKAQVCYVYLADVPSGEDPCAADSRFRKSDWFKRGWTLQELIAPLHVVFFDESWKIIGTKASLQQVVSEITHIPTRVLLMNAPGNISVAERMYWASGRKTARVEDEAYCLMGLFGVSMPMVYGEGKRAFERLQLEILKISDDQSLFAWGSADPKNAGVLASSPAEFRNFRDISYVEDEFHQPYSMTNKGLHITLPFVTRANEADDGNNTDHHDKVYIAVLSCRRKGRKLGIFLQKKVQGTSVRYIRVSNRQLLEMVNDDPLQNREIYIRAMDHSKFQAVDWMERDPQYIFSFRNLPRPRIPVAVEHETSLISWIQDAQPLQLRFWTSGHAGILVFKRPNLAGYLAVCIGVHNYNIWCDMVMVDTDNIQSLAQTNWDGSRQRRWKNYDRMKLPLSDPTKVANLEIWRGRVDGQRAYLVDFKIEGDDQFVLHKIGRGCCFGAA